MIQRWNKLLSDLQAIRHFKTPRINKMCKNKWNCIHGDYKQRSDYHKGIKNNTLYWDFTLEE